MTSRSIPSGVPDRRGSSPRAPRTRSPHAAAFLSFLLPGLGHWYAGRRRPAIVYAAPAIGIAVIVLAQALVGIEQLAALLITPTSALTILILVVLFAVWRVLAIADSMRGFGVRAPWRRGRTAMSFAALTIGVVVVHASLGYVAWAFYDAGSRIFIGDRGPDAPPPAGTAAPGASALPEDEYGREPFATPETATSRITVLLTGVDSSESRSHALTDTMIVLSVDPETGTAAMVSFPRDIANFEMSDGRVYTGKLNSLMTQARLHPKQYPGKPLDTLARELGHLVGTPIHYYAAIDLDGFRKMIDAVGGVTIDNPRAINDPHYALVGGKPGFTLSAGRHKLDGATALAYVRSRYGTGDSDYTRAARQQQVLVALRAKLTNPAMITKLPAILDAAADTIKTNFPSDRVGEMLSLATDFDDDELTSVVLGPPYSKHPPMSQTGGQWTLKLNMKRLANLSVELFGDDSRYAEAAAQGDIESR